MSVRRAALLLPLLTAGCDRPDLSPIRDGLARSAAIVCAPPPVRPAHAPKVRDVSAAELHDALAALCQVQDADAPRPSTPAGVVHDALLADRANVGEARRSGNAPPTCALIDRVILAPTPNISEELDRCADVIALARDEDLTGNVTDVLLANGQIQRAVAWCLPIVEHAPKDAAVRLHSSLVILRSTFPTGIDDAVARDHAELLLLHFGQARAQDTPLACPRATQIASTSQPIEGPAKLLARWRASQEPMPGEELAKYREAYTLTLGALDRLVSLADVAAK